MRDILFKAKRIDNGEWVEGFYALKGVEEFERHMIVVSTFNANTAGYPFYFTEYEVDPSTVCQSTGLKDKNGNLIWENDIMMGHLDDKYPDDTTYTLVLWRKSGFCTNEKYSKDIEPIDEFDQKYFEVCGNIFDNPELIKV